MVIRHYLSTFAQLITDEFAIRADTFGKARSNSQGVTGRFSSFSRYLAERDWRALIEHMMEKENTTSTERERRELQEESDLKDIKLDLKEVEETEWGEKIDDEMEKEICELNKMDNMEEIQSEEEEEEDEDEEEEEEEEEEKEEEEEEDILRELVESDEDTMKTTGRNAGEVEDREKEKMIGKKNEKKRVKGKEFDKLIRESGFSEKDKEMCVKERRNIYGEANYENAINGKERRNVMQPIPVLFRQGKIKTITDSDSDSDDEERFYDGEDL